MADYNERAKANIEKKNNLPVSDIIKFMNGTKDYHVEIKHNGTYDIKHGENAIEGGLNK